MRKLSWDYMACLTDGEGSIFITGRTSSRQVNIIWTQCEANAWWLDYIVKFLNEQGIRFSDAMRTPKNGFTHREIGVYEQASTRKCIEKMLPYLILKQDRAFEALAFLDAKSKAQAQRKRYCVNGHARTPANIYTHKPSGKRYCRMCKKLRQQGIDPKTSVPGWTPGT